MRLKKDRKDRSKMLKRERKMKRGERRYSLVLENYLVFEEASYRGEEYPVTESEVAGAIG